MVSLSKVMTGDTSLSNGESLDSQLLETRKSTTLVLTVDGGIGALAKIAIKLQQHEIDLKHLETRPSRRDPSKTDFLLIIDRPEKHLTNVISELKSETSFLHVVPPRIGQEKFPRLSSNGNISGVWFPGHISDLDHLSNQLVDIDESYDTTAPGWEDPKYRERRYEVIALAKAYRHGKPLPHVDYKDEEVKTWKKVFETQTKLYPTHACQEYNLALKALRDANIYCADRIPEFEEVSNFLKRRTGFTLRPVAGFLSPRNFLNSLAFRVFHATQYIRHHDEPFYTPEPDVCHDLLGHAPLFVDPDFAEFSQELGLASLGASDEVIEKLSNVYWYTLEFGMCLEGGNRKAYGAGLLSGIGELPRCVQDDVKTLPLDPEVAAVEKYIFNGFQHLYFVADSFKGATKKFHEFSKKFPRPYVLRYNPLLQSIDVYDNQEAISSVIEESRKNMEMAREAMMKLNVES